MICTYLNPRNWRMTMTAKITETDLRGAFTSTRGALANLMAEHDRKTGEALGHIDWAAQELYDLAPREFDGYLRRNQVFEKLMKYGIFTDTGFALPGVSSRLELQRLMEELQLRWKNIVKVEFSVPDTTKMPNSLTCTLVF